MGCIAFFDTIHKFHYTISANFTFIYITFSKKFSVLAK